MDKRSRQSQTVQFLQQLDGAIKEWSLLTHPFYRAWNAGELDSGVLGEYAKQYYAHVYAFPAYVSGVHSQCEDPATRQFLLGNLIEEEHGPENHPELWLRFAEGLGIHRNDVHGVTLFPETTASVERLRTLTRQRGVGPGLAALYAYESQIPEVARSKREGLMQFYGISEPGTLSFFTVHEEADVWHSRGERELLGRLCTTPDLQADAIASAEAAARALWSFLDGVYSHCLDGRVTAQA